MPPGEPRPFISQENVRAALDALLYTSADRAQNPLRFLLLVDEFLTQPDLPPLQDARDFALAHILTNLVTTELNQLRHTLGLSLLIPDEPLPAVSQRLDIDAQASSIELLSWDWLYCRYVRVDLNLTPEAFSKAVHIDERTLRRYQQHAVKRLAERIAEEEWAVRAARRKRRLYSEIPGQAGRPLVGRNNLLAQLESRVRINFSQVIYLTGAAGVGKTSLVEALLALLVEADLLDEIVWVQRPASVSFARQAVNQRLLPEAGHISLREYLLLYRAAVVFDDITRLQVEPEHLQQLLKELNPALVILISQRFTAIPDAVHLIVPELNQTEAETLTRQLISAGQSFDQDDETMQTIWQQVGGNPLAIQLTAQNRKFYDRTAASRPSVERLFSTLYGYMDDRLKQNWMMFALYYPRAVTTDECQILWPNTADHEAVQTLQQWHVLEPAADGKWTLSSAARQYIATLYLSGGQTHKYIDQLLESLDTIYPLQTAFDILENLLLDDWLQLSAARKNRWIRELWPEGLRRERWANWRRILDTFRVVDATVEPIMDVAYGRCLRRLGEWQLAHNVFDEAIRRAGLAGKFLDQAAALLELAILLRYEGAYEQAEACVVRAERTAKLHRADSLVYDLQMERAQIAFEANNTHTALSLLSALPPSKRALALLSEVYLAEGDWERSQRITEQLLSQETHAGGIQARLFTTLARSWEHQGNLPQAQVYFSSALTLLENQGEPFALARAQANLGVVLLHSTATWEEACQLLSQAEQTQIRLNDRAALETTRHNLRLAHTRFRS